MSLATPDRASVGVECSEHRGRRAHLVHQGDREQGRRSCAPCQVDAVEVSERVVGGLLEVPPARDELL